MLSFVKRLTLIHWALLPPVIFSAAFAYYMNTTSPQSSTGDLEALTYIPPLFFFGAVILSYALPPRILAGVKKGDNLEKKLGTFQAVHLVRMALFEGSAVIAAIIAYMTSDNLNLVITPAVVFIFIVLRPSTHKIGQSLGLTPEEAAQLK